MANFPTISANTQRSPDTWNSSWRLVAEPACWLLLRFFSETLWIFPFAVWHLNVSINKSVAKLHLPTRWNAMVFHGFLPWNHQEQGMPRSPTGSAWMTALPRPGASKEREIRAFLDDLFHLKVFGNTHKLSLGSEHRSEIHACVNIILLTQLLHIVSHSNAKSYLNIFKVLTFIKCYLKFIFF